MGYVVQCPLCGGASIGVQHSSCMGYVVQCPLCGGASIGVQHSSCMGVCCAVSFMWRC